MLSSMFPRLDYACYERGWITRYELTHLLRAMRRYNNAILNSDNHAVTKPRLVQSEYCQFYCGRYLDWLAKIRSILWQD